MSDEGRPSSKWRTPDRATVVIDIENVNTHAPVWFPDPPPNETIEIEEEKDVVNQVVLNVNARDSDVGEENKRVSYYFKLNNQNIGRTNEFSINENTGEVRPLVVFDRETVDK